MDPDAPGTAPSTKSVWKKNWLMNTAAVVRTAEGERPASAIHTMLERPSGTTTPTQPGTDPPPATCESNAANVANVAATPPRVTRVTLAERMPLVCHRSRDLPSLALPPPPKLSPGPRSGVVGYARARRHAAFGLSRSHPEDDEDEENNEKRAQDPELSFVDNLTDG